MNITRVDNTTFQSKGKQLNLIQRGIKKLTPESKFHNNINTKLEKIMDSNASMYEINSFLFCEYQSKSEWYILKENIKNDIYELVASIFKF